MASKKTQDTLTILGWVLLIIMIILMILKISNLVLFKKLSNINSLRK